ncbi:hypothetical protein NF27_JJ00030 [Candidatus Jidaibacter acanthamoeba]|uniref:Uncharacterized protein n=1 Tax=Candidatus Jidaibacter acanthamoebae TaxID=86105 RepID=A0A0C1QF05_9RICK|nr:hypothetical protein [Candidatus Jidaibacter acanthamoeba]KIE04119.1 hypothetical protein NF27_JJ00030 [Candidatus Jidaibacter acanthamoeba]
MDQGLLQKLLEKDLEKHDPPTQENYTFKIKISYMASAAFIKSIYRFYDRKLSANSSNYESTWDCLTEEEDLIDFALITEIRLRAYNKHRGQTWKPINITINK